MPPSMAKNTSSSVRDRIAAFEKSGGTDNTIIRARANAVEPSRALMGHIDRNTGGELPALIQPGRLHLFDANQADEYKSNGVEKASRRINRNAHFPQLNTSPRQKMQKDRDIVDYIESQARQAMTVNSSESDSSPSLPRNISSGIRLQDHLSTNPGKRTFANLGMRQNGVIINGPSNPSLDVTLPPRSKSAHEVSTEAPPVYETADNEGSHSVREPKDMATQTMLPKRSTTSVEFLDPLNKGGRSTQTDQTPYVIIARRRSDTPLRKNEYEERQALFNVIEEALGETIDRYSRVRTNQIIANSARKQAQIWRDAKDFIGTQLLPQSIQLANRSKTASRTAAEIVANIKIYP